MSSIQEALNKAQRERGGMERPELRVGLRAPHPKRTIFKRLLFFIVLPLITGMILAGLWLRSAQTKSPVLATYNVLKSLLNTGKSPPSSRTSHHDETSPLSKEKKRKTINTKENDRIKRKAYSESTASPSAKPPGKPPPSTEKIQDKKISRLLKVKRETALKAGFRERIKRETEGFHKEESAVVSPKDFGTGLGGQEAFRKADTMYRKGDIDQAIALYKLAIRGPQAAKEAYIKLGNIYFEKKEDIDQAIFYYRKAVEVNPIDAKAHNNLGTGYLKKGDVKGAITEYLKAIELKDDFAIAYYNMACAQIKQGANAEALSWMKKAITLEPESLRWAKEDPDFDDVKDQEAFQALLKSRKDNGGGPRGEMDR